ncbi:MAG: hypothetical protein M0Q38_01355 [Bacteroidales bacterium]|jgi:hypothetical protein|nr:hypothetical protein [Bacteroidales bacterium]
MDKVIFDTNAYRDLAPGRTLDNLDKILVRIRKRESENDIQALMSPIVTGASTYLLA